MRRNRRNNHADIFKVAAVLMLSFGGYYLLMGLSALMASGQIGQVAQSMDETIDPALASQATVQLGLMMLSIGVLEGLAGLFGLLGGKRRKLLIASLAISGVMLVANLVTLATTPFDWVYLVELSLPVMLLAAGIGVLRMGPENQPPRLSR